VESVLDGGRRRVLNIPVGSVSWGGVTDREFYSGFAQRVRDLAEKAAGSA